MIQHFGPYHTDWLDRAMDLEAVRRYCLSLPQATEDIQWGDDLLFRVGGKIFAGISLNSTPDNRLSFKCAPEKFAELIEKQDIIPAPYTARYSWVMLERLDALSPAEIKDLLKQSYEMVFAKLPAKVKAQLGRK
jgi:predicted DNA-binding protein (MmcQ/YjbR family)